MTERKVIIITYKEVMIFVNLLKFKINKVGQDNMSVWSVGHVLPSTAFIS